MSDPKIPVFFHPAQLDFKPLYEWAFGERIDHPETTARAESILAALRGAPEIFDVHPPRALPLTALRAQHDYQLLSLYNTARRLAEGQTFYPTVFPRERPIYADPHNIHHAGAFCFDSGTPLNAQTFDAAVWSAACAKDAAEAIRSRATRLAYALSRPPGHHATRDLFGGYCYFNNAALAARHLRGAGRVAIIDIDFHHGNGTQSLFYRDSKVLTISVHGDPRAFFPFFAGYPTETGAKAGLGYNMNLVLETGADAQAYLRLLDEVALPAVRSFAPAWLIVAAGFDTYHKDPVGRFDLQTTDYADIGERLGRLGLPTVVVQEGGYYTPDLGLNARTFLCGARDGQRAPRPALAHD
ncbi:histone deacetylase family protein [Myxococcota bacterium]|nr:histone deacetylase family protein [Myxococcota bacterium]MBU1430321.1 histone deacetylase family protein [Myxococcota bacterium]